MIAGLVGKIDGATNDALLINVQGVIYTVGTSGTTIAAAGSPGDEVQLFTEMVVREDAISLFGFLDKQELAIFQSLRGVPGIGPSLACAILTTFSPERLAAAVTAGDADLLATTPGVGKKIASRLIVDLRGKLPEEMVAGAAKPNSVDAEVIAALRSLGYTAVEASAALNRLPALADQTVENRLYSALQVLGES